MEDIAYMADKVLVHRWPLDSPEWSKEIRSDLDAKINKNPAKCAVTISPGMVKIDGYEFDGISKVGVSVPMFQRKCTIIFEGRFEGLCAHVHVSIFGGEYLEVCQKASAWRDEFFAGSVHES